MVLQTKMARARTPCCSAPGGKLRVETMCEEETQYGQSDFMTTTWHPTRLISPASKISFPTEGSSLPVPNPPSRIPHWQSDSRMSLGRTKHTQNQNNPPSLGSPNLSLCDWWHRKYDLIVENTSQRSGKSEKKYFWSQSVGGWDRWIMISQSSLGADQVWCLPRVSQAPSPKAKTLTMFEEGGSL